jgi:hypothetical protein
MIKISPTGEKSHGALSLNGEDLFWQIDIRQLRNALFRG